MPSILIVDDEAGVRRFLRIVLEGAGYAVWEAGNGREAVALVRRTEFDLLILDLVMPEQEGLETIRELRTEYPSLKIIGISGAFVGVYPDTMLRMATLLGARAALSKPFSADTVLETVQRVLDSA